TVHAGRREAERTLNEMVVAAERGSLAKTQATVGELLEAWFDHARPDLSPKTVRETRGYLDRSLVPQLGEIRLDRLRSDRIDAPYRMLRERGGAGGKPLAPATVRRIHVILRRSLQQGVRWGWLPTNPAAAASPPRVPVTTIALPSPGDVAQLYRLA